MIESEKENIRKIRGTLLAKKKIANPQTLEFAYFEGQKILSTQVSAADTLDTKIVAIFSVATVIIGVVPPIINSWVSRQSMSILQDYWALSLLIFAGICYLVVFGFSLWSCWTRAFGIIPSINYVYERLDVNPSDMRKTIVIKHMKKAYDRNKDIVRHKAKTLRIVIIMVGIEVLFLLCLFTRVSWLV